MRTAVAENVDFLCTDAGCGRCVMRSAEDALEAVTRGASAVVVSNHGGRQLDTAPAPVCLPVSLTDSLGFFLYPRTLTYANIIFSDNEVNSRAI